MYLLDTNVCIQILNRASFPVVHRLAQHSPAEFYLCSMVKAELLYGARHHSQRITENLTLLEKFFAPFHSLAFDG